jgi:hypothetical protein
LVCAVPACFIAPPPCTPRTNILPPNTHTHKHTQNSYLSGELLQGRTAALDKADVFALGATLYELASGAELPKAGPVYQRLRQGKVSMLPTFTTQFLNVVKVRAGGGGWVCFAAL